MRANIPWGRKGGEFAGQVISARVPCLGLLAESGNKYKYHKRASDDVKEFLRRWAKAWGCNRSDVVRYLVIRASHARAEYMKVRSHPDMTLDEYWQFAMLVPLPHDLVDVWLHEHAAEGLNISRLAEAVDMQDAFLGPLPQDTDWRLNSWMN